MNDVERQIATVAAQAAVMALKQYGTKAPVGAPSAVGWTHGVGGFLGVPGIDPEVISARVQPRGLLAALPFNGTPFTHPEYAYITGIEDLTEDEPNTECETCIQATTEGCIQSACFGRICRETRELTPRRAVERINRGDIDMALLNDMLGKNEWSPWLPFTQYDLRSVLNVATMQALMEVAASILNPLVRMVWTGNPANNSGTGYQEFNGLDILINQTKVDYKTGTRCEALDSDVKDFNYQNLNTVDAAGNVAIVRQLSALEEYVYFNASRMGLLPAEWVWCMRPETWRELTEMWPIAYLTTRNIVLPAGNTMNIDATRISTMRDEMRRGMTLEVNGRTHRVVTCDGIAEQTNVDNANIPANGFASNIYLVPLTFTGRRQATYMQYLDYRLAAPEIRLARSQNRFWTDGTGKFLWTVEYLKFCYTLSTEIVPRIVLKVPQLAGRLNNVVYTPEQHFRSPFEDDYHFHKGGVDHRAYPQGRVYPDHARRQGVIPTGGGCEE